MSYKYDEVRDQLLARIKGMKVGERLPNRTVLSNELNVARTTLEHALSELTSSGYLCSKIGSGTYVARIDDNVAEDRWSELPKQINLRQDTWAFLVNNISKDAVPSILRGISDVAQKNNYQLLICNTNDDQETQENYLYKLTKDGICGIIVMPSVKTSISPRIWKTISERGVHIVSCYRPIPGYSTPGFYCNSHLAGYLATEHLINMGCKRILMISGMLYQTVYDRYQGYRSALFCHHIQASSELFSYETDSEFLEKKMPNLSKSIENGLAFDGIFAFNDSIAKVVYDVLQKKGLMPGKDIPIIGCDDTRLCMELNPRLSSIHFPTYELGCEAASLLHKLCQGIDPSCYFSMMDCELKMRESSNSYYNR